MRGRRKIMTRRTALVIAVFVALACGVLVTALPAGATRVHDVDPTKIDPAQLALPQSALPAGTVIDLSKVSDNADADSSTTHNLLHHQFYETWHRITGYRMDYHYTVQGVVIEAGYLASIFPTPADARAALDDATGPGSVIQFLGTPLPDPCTAGDLCRGYSGPNPQDGTKTGLVADFVRGPILVEAATQVPNDAFAQLKTVMEAQAYGVVNTMDVQVKAALTGGPSNGATDTPTPTATVTPLPTDTPTPKPAPAKKCKKNQHLTHGKCACVKGYKLVHGKCKKVKKH
jgi:hypothetical protein